jgi:hypothetical protein
MSEYFMSETQASVVTADSLLDRNIIFIIILQQVRSVQQ